MRFATYRHARDQVDRVGVVIGDELAGMEPGSSLLDLLGDDGEHLATAGARAVHDPVEVVPIANVELRAPIPVPPSIRDFLGFEAHVRNARGVVDPAWYELPVFYFSNPAAVRGPNDEIEIAPGSFEWDYELECAAVIGRAGHDLAPADAERYIAGYTVLCDFSARDLQRTEVRQGLGPAKGKDSATSLGPFLVSPDELGPFRSKKAFALEMEVSVNGRRYGGGRLDDLYWSFGEMIAYASRGTTIRPGDVFGTGTVGTGCLLEWVRLGRGGARPWLEVGDQVEIAVEHLGVLRHRIVPGRPVIPLR
jgi:2-keto-4-pentenoate hydratase/2-oxohepta-3-ene-1,7-dioic acid hydratase in catechol pathway